MHGQADEVHVWYGHTDRASPSKDFLRRVLGHYTGTPPETLELASAPCTRCGGAHGKPFLVGHPELHFNLSDSVDLVAVAVSQRHEVGLDVQVVKASTRSEALARRFFSPADQTYLDSIDDGGRREAFFRLWARKEACLKATGEGLTVHLSDLTVSGVSMTRRGVAWSIADLDPRPGFVGAVVSAGGDWRVVERPGSDL